MTRQRLARLFLAATLVLAQYGVFAHALSHLGKTPCGQDGSSPASHPAEVCVAFAAASGGALGSDDLPLYAESPPDHFIGPAPIDPLLQPLALTRFASRAPPLPA